MRLRPMLSLSCSFSDLAQKESECLEEFCESIRKNDGFSEENGGCNEESLADGAEITIEDEFQEKLKLVQENGLEEDEFEFPLIAINSVSSPAVADEIFCDGRIRPMYSVSGQYSELNGAQLAKSSIETTTPPPVVAPALQQQEATRIPLRMLFLEESFDPPSSSCSSSEADDLDGVAPGTYCIWEPKLPAAETAEGEDEGQCKKSNSTGSSKKRLKFRKFLNRSTSDGGGRDRVVFPPSDNAKKKKDEKSHKSGEGRRNVTADMLVKSGGEKRRHRRDMVGILGNATVLTVGRKILRGPPEVPGSFCLHIR